MLIINASRNSQWLNSAPDEIMFQDIKKLSDFMSILLIFGCDFTDCFMTFVKAKKKTVVLSSEISQLKNFLSLTWLHSQICTRICIFYFKKASSKQTKKTQKAKETQKKPENISGKLIKKKFAAAQVKIFLVICISRNKSNFFGPNL